MSSNDITELRRTADLALRATKGTAHAIGRSMAALVAAERHLWLTLSDIREKDRVFLLDAPLAPSGLFGDTVESVVDRHQEARKVPSSAPRPVVLPFGSLTSKILILCALLVLASFLEADAGFTAHAFIPAGHYVTPSMTSRPSIG